MEQVEDNNKNIAIFKSITLLISHADFHDDQKSFITKNYKIFNDEEENKHQYKQVYDQYLEIMERTIEAKLLQDYNYTDNEINEFYTSFKANMKAYEKLNPNTVDSLYSFVNFEKFKKDMLEMKKSIDLSESTSDSSAKTEFNKAKDSNISIDEQLQTFSQLLAEDHAKAPWFNKLFQKEPTNGFMCNLWQRKQNDSPYDIVRIHATFRGVKAEDFIRYFFNRPLIQAKHIKDQKTLEQPSENDKTQYSLFKIPLTSDRDTCIRQIYKKLDDGSTFIIKLSVNHKDAPEKPGVIRTSYYSRGLIKQSETDPETVEYTAFSMFSLGGYVPARLMNIVVSQQMLKSFKDCHEHLVVKKDL